MRQCGILGVEFRRHWGVERIEVVRHGANEYLIARTLG